MREIIIAFIAAMCFVAYLDHQDQPKVDLPEEYQAMKEDTLIGAYERKTNTVHIWFVNKNQ